MPEEMRYAEVLKFQFYKNLLAQRIDGREAYKDKAAPGTGN